MDYIAQSKDYWIARNAISITLNVHGGVEPYNRIQGSVASGASILCYIKNNAGEVLLDYNSGHQFQTWPLSLSPTFFNTDTAKYVYVAIPRTEEVGTTAVIVFPSEVLDVYGINSGGTQVGSTDFYYIYLHGIISEVLYEDGEWKRKWLTTPNIDTGSKGTDEALNDPTESEWYRYVKTSGIVTLLKEIVMDTTSWFRNLRIGNSGIDLNGVATADTSDAFIDSETLVATPSYINANSLSKKHDDTAEGNITFNKNIDVKGDAAINGDASVGGDASVNGDLGVKGFIKGLFGIFSHIKSPNYTGDSIADTGYLLTSDNNGHSKLTIDEIYVRMKATFESLEVRERTYSGGDQIWSCAGNQIVRTDYMGNAESADHVPVMMQCRADGSPVSGGTETEPVVLVPMPGDTYGYSTIKVPWLVRNIPFLANLKAFAKYRTVRIVMEDTPAESRGGNRTAANTPISNVRRARCYFLAKDGDREIHNWWRINDLARCQTMNISSTTRKTYLSGEDTKQGNVFWWRKVIGVSFEPVTLDDGKQYHYFDVSFDYDMEQTQPAAMATSVMEGSDIPAAGDSVVQFGNTIMEGRMNLMMMEVNGGDSITYPNHTDAPCLKAYRGIYCFDLNKCWVGGKCCKMTLSPSTGYEFYGPNFRYVEEYGTVPSMQQRGLWTDICRKKNSQGQYANQWEFEKDDYGRTNIVYSDDSTTGRDPLAGGVRKCYYYDTASHNGSVWLCSIVDGVHWVNGNGEYISDAQYAALSEANKALCERRQNYTAEEPGPNSVDWTEIVQKGEDGGNVVMSTITPNSALVETDENGNVGSERSSTHRFELYVGETKQTSSFDSMTFVIDRITIDDQYHDEASPRRYFKVTTVKDANDKPTGTFTVYVNAAYTNFTGEVMEITAAMTIEGVSVSRTVLLPIYPVKQGDAGEDSILLKADPENILITQDTVRQGSAYPLIVVDSWTIDGMVYDILGSTQLKIVDGSTEKTTDFTVGTPVPSTFVDSGTGVAKNSCTVVKDGTRIGIIGIGADSGLNRYVTTGYVTIPVTYGSKNYSVRLNFYCDLLGVWKSSVETGAEEAVSQKISYVFFGDELHEISETGEFVRGWELASTVISKQVGNLLVNSSQWQQSSDHAYQNVWSIETVSRVKIEKGMFLVTSKEKDWGVKVKYYASASSSIVIDTETIDMSMNEDGEVYKAEMTVPSGASYAMIVLCDLQDSVEHIVSTIVASAGVCLSMVPTSGYVKVTAENVSAGVQSVIEGKLYNTGIDIQGNNRTIKLQADKVTFSDAAGGNTNKILIDPTTGTLHAENARITGGVFVDRVGIYKTRAYHEYNPGSQSGMEGDDLTHYLFEATPGEEYDDSGYYEIGSISLKNNHLFVYAEGIHNYIGTMRGESYLHIMLPPPHLFIGQSIVITNETFGFTDGAVTLEQAYIMPINPLAPNDGSIMLTEYTFKKGSPDYPYGTSPAAIADLIDGAPYAIDPSGLVLLNGVWQLVVGSSGNNDYKYPVILDAIALDDYEWLEVTAVEGEYKKEQTVIPAVAEDYNAVWMITRWEKKNNE